MCICDAKYVLEKSEADVYVFVVGMIYALARKRQDHICGKYPCLPLLAFASLGRHSEPKRTM
jgi:hypothetical protein